MDRVQIFDTTLRDGEQSPGATMNTEEKVAIARQLEHLGVDVIEAGFAASSEGDFDAVRRVAELATYERLFSLWHLLHLPLFFMLLVAGVVHIVAVHVY